MKKEIMVPRLSGTTKYVTLRPFLIEDMSPARCNIAKCVDRVLCGVPSCLAISPAPIPASPDADKMQKA